MPASARAPDVARGEERGEPRSAAVPPAAVFYFDLVSPPAYLIAERLPSTLGGSIDWQPVRAGALAAGETFEAFRCAEERSIFRAELERRAHAQPLQPLVWPQRFPFDSELALRVATFARSIGRGAAFALAAFRQAFAAGRDLSELDSVLIAAAACEMHPRAIISATARASIVRALDTATDQAIALAVTDVPALRLGGRLLVGLDEVERGLGARAR